MILEARHYVPTGQRMQATLFLSHTGMCAYDDYKAHKTIRVFQGRTVQRI